jgi:hypothetical protein
MADRSTFAVKTPKSDVQLLTAKLQGGGAADMVNTESGNLGGGEVVSAVRTGAGTFNLTFRKKYPELKCCGEPGIIGTTAGLDGRFSAFDTTAGTATLVLEVGAVATDPATTDFVHLSWFVRNSGFNK